MRQVAAVTPRLAPAARRGLAHLARIAGDFPTALAVAQQVGWEGRHHRILGDLWWVQGDMDQAAAAHRTAREEAEQHAVAGERATCQAQLALVACFTAPQTGDNELALAERFLVSLNLRATTITTRIAALARDAGTTDVEQRAELLRADITTAGLAATAAPALELVLAFHHAVQANEDLLEAAIRQPTPHAIAPVTGADSRSPTDAGWSSTSSTPTTTSSASPGSSPCKTARHPSRVRYG
ncbi:hypothetical protein [Saccharothrix sp. ST-888]|uniref:hypothetical protein n=1 Tax=Saccharothrix sp. ST-888 TaxID=1427391 RepID=UPI0005ECFBB0|nr:hypothetical protein [Saccharothrix sp. ST-888]KJK56407.1 hypothetical protein UK12_22800 [Saccharothrix sp. ST-888]